MNILIVGCNGFVGNALVKFYSKKKWIVSGCDIVPDSKKELFAFFKIDPKSIDYAAIFKNNSFDICINAAGAANVSASITAPLYDYQLNVFNLALLLESIRCFDPQCKVINLSSAAVYGNPQYLPIDEMHPVAPISPYGWHKYQSEILCTEYHKVYGVHTCSARIFSAYGPGLKKQLFWDLNNKSKNQDVINLFGSGQESRDFIYIDDLVQAIDLIFQNADFKADIINVANGTEIFIDKLVSLFLSILNNKATINFTKDLRIGDPKNWKADINKLQRWGYCQQVDLNKGIENYLLWLQE